MGVLGAGLIALFIQQWKVASKLGAVCQEVKDLKEYLLNNNER